MNLASDPTLFNKRIELDINKRGSGAFDKPQYQPYTYYLNAGKHTLPFRGREANSNIDYYKPVPVQSTKKGDLNADSKFDVSDMGILLGSWGKAMKPPADLNQSGYVDVTDLWMLLGNWG
jgi:hypothetical protein